MSWETSKRVWENVPPSVTKNERLALLALAERSDKYGVCWPGYDDIGRMVGVDPRSAMRLIKSLEKQKQILILHQMGMKGGRGYTNLYLVITGLSPENINEIITNHPSFNDKGDKIDTLLGYKKGDKTDIKGVEIVTHNPEKGDNFDQKGDNFCEKGDTAMSPEPSLIEPSLIEPKERDEINPGPLSLSLVNLCQINLDTMTRRQKESLKGVISALTQPKINATPELVNGYREWWKQNWRGKNNSPPMLSQILELWGEYTAWRNGPKERTNGHNHLDGRASGQRPQIDDADITKQDEYIKRIQAHPRL